MNLNLWGVARLLKRVATKMWLKDEFGSAR